MTEPEKPSPHQEQSSEDADNSRRVLGLSFESLSLIFDGIIAVAAIVGSFFVYRQLVAVEDQLGIMRDQLTDARKAATDADAITKRQVTIAESLASSLSQQALVGTIQAMQSMRMAGASQISAANSDRIARGSESAVTIAQDSARADQRAWVGILNVTDFAGVDAPLVANVMAMNTGKTPALNVRSHAEFRMDVIATGQPVPAYDMTRDRDDVVSVTVLHPSQQLTLPLRRDSLLLPDQVRNIKDGRAQLYMRAIITYDDVFTRIHEGVGFHRTERCDVYIPKRNMFVSCDFGNYAN